MADFFLDGRKRSERVWTEREANAVPMIFSADDGAAFGFSTPAGFENWLAKSGLSREYAKAKTLLERTPRNLTRQRETEVSARQAGLVDRYAAELTETLRKANIRPDDGLAVMEFLRNYDPLTGPLIHSVLLYEHAGCTGQWRYLPKGVVWSNFAIFGFDNTCTSVAVYYGGIMLFENPGFTGRSVGIAQLTVGWRNLHTYPYYFNDRASSAITW